MEKALWYLLAGTRGGANRTRIIRSLDERPRNANQLSEDVGLDYNTTRHHLELLVEHNVLEKGGNEYGALYFLTDQFEHNRESFENIVDQLE